MPDTFPEDLGGMLDRFEATLNEKHAGRAAHVGARAELDAVTAEIMQLRRQLDALNRFGFKSNAEALGAWRSARNVAWPRNERGEGALEGGRCGRRREEGEEVGRRRGRGVSGPCVVLRPAAGIAVPVHGAWPQGTGGAARVCRG
jgi:hypothetical protein